MNFCVECGREGPTFEGVCQEDYRAKHVLLRPPQFLDLAQCVHCGRFRLGTSWVNRTVDNILHDLLPLAVEQDDHVEGLRFTHKVHPEDSRNFSLSLQATYAVGPWEFNDALNARLRVQKGACPRCSRQQGKFFVGTVQVRGEGRDLTPDEMRRARDMITRTASDTEFVSSVEDVPGGLDAKVSTNAFARRLARAIATEFGGEVGSSATLHTQKEGKEMYRSTYVVRLPGFREGDLILWRRGRYRVIALDISITLEDPKSRERIRVRPRELQRAKVVTE